MGSKPSDPRALKALIQDVAEKQPYSSQMKELIGALDMTNLAQLGETILSYEALTNEFTHMLCKVAEIWIRQKNIRNPLSMLKRAEPSPLGLDIEEVFVNAAEEKDFDPCGSTLLACNANDIKVAYYRRTREKQFEAYVSRPQMQCAFTSWAKLDSLVQRIVNSLYDGNQVAEWNYTRALFGEAAKQNIILNQYNVAAPVDEATGKNLVKQLRLAGLNMQMPGSSYNSYMNLPNAIGNPVITQTQPEDLILIIRTDALANIDVEVLARAFNIQYSDFIGQVLKVDSFLNADGTPNPNQLCFLGDRNAAVIVPQVEETSNFWNAQALKYTYYLTLFQIWAMSPFWNGVMFNSGAAPTP